MKNITGIMLALVISASMMTACENNNAGSETRPGEAKVKMTDSELETAIKNRINSDTRLNAAGIDVDANADNKSATLSGTVETQELRTRAVELAKSALSGLIVEDKIDVKPRELTRETYTEELARQERDRARDIGDRIGESLDDAWIHTKVVAQLVGNSATPERKINVDVNNNVVTLRGTVDSAEQKVEAERVAKMTEGVNRVVNQLKVSAKKRA